MDFTSLHLSRLAFRGSSIKIHPTFRFERVTGFYGDLKVDESEWKWVKMDWSGWNWIIMDESGWKYMKMDKSRWKWMEVMDVTKCFGLWWIIANSIHRPGWICNPSFIKSASPQSFWNRFKIFYLRSQASKVFPWKPFVPPDSRKTCGSVGQVAPILDQLLSFSFFCLARILHWMGLQETH